MFLRKHILEYTALGVTLRVGPLLNTDRKPYFSVPNLVCYIFERSVLIGRGRSMDRGDGRACCSDALLDFTMIWYPGGLLTHGVGNTLVAVVVSPEPKSQRIIPPNLTSEGNTQR